MKYIILILSLVVGYGAFAQTNPSGIPTQLSTGWFRHGWDQSDSGKIFTSRAPNFTPRFPGTVEFYQNAGVDSLLSLWTGGRWIKLIPGVDSTSMSNRINLKLNIVDTTDKWWGVGKRWVDTVYRKNDSTVAFTINGGAEQTFQILGGSSGGGGGTGTVTSVGLSLPSAFSVTPSTITTSGTFNVTMPGLSTQYVRANGTIATTDTGMIPNFYLKVRSLFSGTSPIAYNSGTGAIGILDANNTGQKGAATFSNSDFIDNGAGLISLRNPPGGPAVDTIFRTPGVDSIYYTINGIQRVIKDSIGGGGSVDSVSATSPIVVTNPTTTPNISMPAATSSVNGYMTSANIQKYDTAVRGKIYTLSQLGILSDADINIGSTSFGTDQKTQIQAVLDKPGPKTLIWDVKASTSGTLTIPSNTTIIFNPGCGVIARDSINMNVFMNANPSTGAAIDSNITLTGADYIINGNGGNQKHDTPANGWVVAVRFVGVNNIIVENAIIVASRTFHIWFMNCNYISIRNIYIDYAPAYNTNAFGTFDGIHINGPSSYIMVNNEKVRSNDDVFALNADDVWQNTDTNGVCVVCGNVSSYDPYATYGDITDVNVDGITFLPGCQFGVRLLSAVSAIKRVTIKNVKGTTSLQEFIIDNWHDGEPAHPGPGNIEDLTLENIFGEVGTNTGGHVYKNCYINMGCVMKNVTITNLARSLFTQPTYPTINIDAYAVIHGLNINGFQQRGETNDGIPWISNSGLVYNLKLSNVSNANPTRISNNSLIKSATGSLINTLQLHNIYFDSIASVIDITDGKIYYINGTNIIHQNTVNSFVYTEDTIKRLTLSNFTSSSNIKFQLGTGGVLLDSAGDAFSQSTGVPTLHQVLTAGNTSTLGESVASVAITRGIGTNRDNELTNSSGSDNFATLTLRPPNGTNVASAISIIPRGTGFSSSVKTQLDLFNTDYVADATNFEDLYIRAEGTQFSFNSIANGTGTVRPIVFTTGANSNQLVIKPTGAIQFGNYTTSGDDELIYVSSTGDLNHFSGGTNGQVLTKTTGGFTWQAPSSATTIYNGDGTLTGNRTVTGSSNSLTFDGIFNFRVNANTFLLAKSTPGAVYTTAVIGANNLYQIGYTPTATVYGKGAGLYIDTNNNAGLGSNMPTSAPLYATGLNGYAANLLVGGGIFEAVGNITSNTTIDLGKRVLRIDATGGNVTITLPAASTAFGSSMGIHYIFKRIDNSGNTVTVQRAGSDTIDGGTSFTLTTQYEVKELQCSSTSTWDIL